MRLLITDDEELTRTGVVASIDWKSLGIEEVIQADDGIHGLEMAKKYLPEIILCDVRMPRMDGITMLEHIKHFLPDTVVIFMSGYSDKEYLKAAIKLKAINYIEKPLNPQEIRDAILDAINTYHQNKQSQHGKNMQSQETISQLASALSSPYISNAEKIEDLCRKLSISFPSPAAFTVFIIKMDGFTELSNVLRTELYLKFEAYLKSFNLHCLLTEKRGKYLVLFVYGTSAPSSSDMWKIGSFLVNSCAFMDKYMIVSGDTYTSIEQAYLAYNTAAVALQCSFFFPRNTFLSISDLSASSKGETFLSFSSEQNDPETIRMKTDDIYHSFSEALLNRNETLCTQLLEQISALCSHNHNLIQGQIQDYYYKLLFSLENARKQMMLTDDSLIVDVIADCFCYQELHSALVSKVREFFTDAGNASSENRTITMIKDYISKNYSQETLSVKDISTHVFLSTSYVCTFFKNETGKTLNQYLTEYRMEKAKLLLTDPRYKIAEISSKVGYSDGNYFGKSFKKYSGFSPSEYREKFTS